MNWSQDTEDALHAFLAPDTCYKPHPIDDVNFYLFIGEVWRDTRQLWDESSVRDIVRQRAEELHGDWDGDLVKEIVDRVVSEGTIILDFLCALKDAAKLNHLLL